MNPLINALWLVGMLCASKMSGAAQRFQTDGFPSAADLRVADGVTLDYRFGGRCPPDMPALARAHCIDEGGRTVIVGPTRPFILAPDVGRWKHEDLEWLLSLQPTLEGTAWLPLNKVEDGQILRARLVQEIGRASGCDDAACITVVEAYATAEPTMQGYAVCEIGKRQAGAPAFCVPIAVSYAGRDYLLAWQTFAAEGGAGRSDFSVSLIWSEGSRELQFSPLVQSVMTAPPWLLTVQNSEHYFLATSAMRSSSIVPPWREELTVRIDFSDSSVAYSPSLAKTFGYKKFSISTTTYVNLLNTDRPEDWHRPSDQMQGRYVSMLMNSMKSVIAGACPTPVDWYDSYHAGCGISKEDKAEVSRLASSLD